MKTNLENLLIEVETKKTKFTNLLNELEEGIEKLGTMVKWFGPDGVLEEVFLEEQYCEGFKRAKKLTKKFKKLLIDSINVIKREEELLDLYNEAIGLLEELNDKIDRIELTKGVNLYDLRFELLMKTIKGKRTKKRA